MWLDMKMGSAELGERGRVKWEAKKSASWC